MQIFLLLVKKKVVEVPVEKIIQKVIYKEKNLKNHFPDFYDANF